MQKVSKEIVYLVFQGDILKFSSNDKIKAMIEVKKYPKKGLFSKRGAIYKSIELNY